MQKCSHTDRMMYNLFGAQAGIIMFIKFQNWRGEQKVHPFVFVNTKRPQLKLLVHCYLSMIRSNKCSTCVHTLHTGLFISALSEASKQSNVGLF